MQEADHNLTVYQSLTRITGQMVDAARSSQWDRLVELEEDCRLLIGSLRLPDANARPGSASAKHKTQLIREALAHDAQVREVTEAWMSQLQKYMGDARRVTQLRRTYQSRGE